MIIRNALITDSPSLIALTALTPMRGTISLRIDRKPDFFSLLNKRGESIVLVAENDEKNVVGSFSAAKQDFRVNGQSVTAYYLGDLKVHPVYSKSLLAYKLVKEMYRQLLMAGADLLVCTAAEGNEAVFPFFDGRAGIPPFRKVNTFNVYQLLPQKGKCDLVFSAYDEEINVFYRDFYQRFCFYPDNFYGRCDLTLTAKKQDEITAAISLFDPMEIKQNVVVDYPFMVGLTLQILRKLKMFFPLPPLPSKGDALRLLYVRQFGFSATGKDDFMQLLQRARLYAFQQQYHFLTMAVDERDQVLMKLVKPLSRFSFRSVNLVTSLSNNQALLEEVCSGIAYEDYSLI